MQRSDCSESLSSQQIKHLVRNILLTPASVKPGEFLVVAVSGGADSVALLHILTSLPELGLNLIVAHLNHCLRRDESDKDEQYVRELAERYGLPIECRRVEVMSLSVSRKISLEEAGREARYEFFRDVARKYSARLVAIAHHADDQAETVLLRLIRGAGGNGLSGMRPVSSDGFLVRPLLGVRRFDVENYLKEQVVAWRNDSSNADQHFLRNRLRHQLLPLLSSYNPAIVDRLISTAETLASDEELLNHLTDSAFTSWGKVSRDCIELDRSGVCKELAGLRLRLYRRCILLLRGDLRHLVYRHLEAIDDLARSRHSNAEIDLPGGIWVRCRYGRLLFAFKPVDSPKGFSVIIEGPGRYSIGETGDYLTVLPAVGPYMAQSRSLLLDVNLYNFPWTVRSFQHGDRFVPSGMSGSKKIKDFFIDKKIPVEERRVVPLLFCGDTLLWIGGIRPSEHSLKQSDSPFLMQVNIGT